MIARDHETIMTQGSFQIESGDQSDKPGSCPKCGMALELAKPTIGGRNTIYTCPLMEDNGVRNFSALDERAVELQRLGRTAMYVALNGELAGLIAVSDPIKDSTPEAVNALHDLGLRIIMLSVIANALRLGTIRLSKE